MRLSHIRFWRSKEYEPDSLGDSLARTLCLKTSQRRSTVNCDLPSLAITPQIEINRSLRWKRFFRDFLSTLAMFVSCLPFLLSFSLCFELIFHVLNINEIFNEIYHNKNRFEKIFFFAVVELLLMQKQTAIRGEHSLPSPAFRHWELMGKKPNGTR